MAKASAPYGFAIWQQLLRARIYVVTTAPVINVMVQDMVASENTGLITPKFGLLPSILDANIIPATTGHTNPLLGVVLECFDENMDPISYIAATRVGDATVAGYILVADHPYQLFTSEINALVTAANLDLNYEIYSPAISAGNTATGISKQCIQNTGTGTTNTIPLRLLGQADPMEDTTAAYAKMICQINPEAHYWGQGTAT